MSTNRKVFWFLFKILVLVGTGLATVEVGASTEDEIQPIREVFVPSGTYPETQYWKVAAIQWTAGDSKVGADYATAEALKQSNRQALAQRIRAAAKNGAKFIVTPEMSIVGYPTAGDYTQKSDLDPYVEPVPGRSTDYFTRLAKELAVWIQISIAEKETSSGKYFNAAVVINSQGTLVATYRKQNLFENENDYFSRGNGAVTFKTPAGVFGVMICADVYSYGVLWQYSGLHLDAISMGAAWVSFNTGMSYFQKAAKSVKAFMIAANQSYAPDAGVINGAGLKQSHIRQTVDGIAYGYLPLK